jgi:hypothetical protein
MSAFNPKTDVSWWIGLRPLLTQSGRAALGLPNSGSDPKRSIKAAANPQYKTPRLNFPYRFLSQITWFFCVDATWLVVSYTVRGSVVYLNTQYTKTPSLIQES